MNNSLITADIITIGDEILIGQITDTNSARIAAMLNETGIRVRRKFSIGDDKEAINAALDECIGQSRVLILTGGLGPTKDDITKTTLAAYFGCGMIQNREVYQMLEEYFSSKGREFSVINQGQAMVPEACRVFLNTRGTAPGMLFEKNGTYIISLPGVPYEMEGLMQDHVLSMLRDTFRLPKILHKTILTQGIPESTLMEMIAPWEDSLRPEVKLAYLPSPGMVRLRLTVVKDFEGAEAYLSERSEALNPYLGSRIYGYDDDTMETVIFRLLQERGATVTFAESCTGGYLAHKLTSLAGSSVLFNGSVVAYSYEAKTELLGVPSEMLLENGAVSEPVVQRMAAGVRELYHADYAVATSGIAGPSGGTPDKPVGTVWIAVAGPKGIRSKKFLFGNDRNRNIQMTFLAGYEMLRRVILEID
jgi:nicotinamide-nucleotide amidase